MKTSTTEKFQLRYCTDCGESKVIKNKKIPPEHHGLHASLGTDREGATVTPATFPSQETSGSGVYPVSCPGWENSKHVTASPQLSTTSFLSPQTDQTGFLFFNLHKINDFAAVYMKPVLV